MLFASVPPLLLSITLLSYSINSMLAANPIRRPFIEEFTNIVYTHTGEAVDLMEGDRLDITCRVLSDPGTQLDILWYYTPNDTLPPDETHMRLIGPREPLELVSWVALEDDYKIKRQNTTSIGIVVIEVKPSHRGYYMCVANNGAPEKARKSVYIRVKSKMVALWPFLGIVAELFILFTVIYVYETRKAQKELQITGRGSSQQLQITATKQKRLASGPTSAPESVPLNN